MECEWVRLPAAKFLWAQIRRNSHWQGWGRRLCEAVHASGEGERVIAHESWEGNLASRRVEESLSRPFSG